LQNYSCSMSIVLIWNLVFDAHWAIGISKRYPSDRVLG
jgi:hypothetical protein